MVQSGTVIAGKVRLTRLLKAGGMGSVWVAQHLTLDVPVAVKFLTHAADAAPSMLDRFSREAKASAKIRSSNVVQVLDHGVDRKVPYIIMELLEGEDLGVRLRRETRLELHEVAYIVRSVARGLQIAHDAGLVHRDLKPANIFLAREGDEVVPKILDFGIAKRLAVGEDASGDTEEGTLLGTPFYMSPEQARGRHGIDHRSDLWSLAVISFRAVVGRRPFTARAIGDVIVQICSDPIPNATMWAPYLPPALDAFFHKALARPVEQRFQSARELGASPRRHRLDIDGRRDSRTGSRRGPTDHPSAPRRHARQCADAGIARGVVSIHHDPARHQRPPPGVGRSRGRRARRGCPRVVGRRQAVRRCAGHAGSPARATTGARTTTGTPTGTGTGIRIRNGNRNRTHPRAERLQQSQTFRHRASVRRPRPRKSGAAATRDIDDATFCLVLAPRRLRRRSHNDHHGLR